MSVTTPTKYTGYKRELVALGGAVPSRRRGRTAIAESQVTINLKDDEAVAKCLAELEASDERLADTPADYDWIEVWKKTSDDTDGGRVAFGVAWYDAEFFNAKKEVYLNADHLKLLGGFGVSAKDIDVKHYRLVD